MIERTKRSVELVRRLLQRQALNRHTHAVGPHVVSKSQRIAASSCCAWWNIGAHRGKESGMPAEGNRYLRNRLHAARGGGGC